VAAKMAVPTDDAAMICLRVSLLSCILRLLQVRYEQQRPSEIAKTMRCPAIAFEQK
jgi:hypothetical protein